MGSTTITEGQLATHHHSPESGGSYFIVSGGNGEANAGGGWGHAFATSTGDIGESQSHTHSFSGVSTSSNSNLVPYYALSYIIRIM